MINKNHVLSIKDILKKSFEVGKDVMLKDFLTMLIINLIYSTLPVLGIIVYQKLFTLIESIALSGQYNVSIFYILLAYLAYLVIMSFNTIYYKRFYIQFLSIIKFEKKVKIYLHNKCNKISSDDFERPNLYNYVIQAQNASTNIYRLIEICIYIVSLIIGTIVVNYYVSTFNKLFIVFIFLSILPSLSEKFYETKQFEYLRDNTTQLYKEEEAYKDCIISPNFLKETRTLGAEKHIQKKWESVLKQILTHEKIVDKKLLKIQSILGLPKVIGNNFGLILATYLYINKQIDFGQFTASIFAYDTLKDNFTELFSMIGYLNQYSNLVKPFFNFLDINEREGNVEENYSFDKSIELKDITFSYPLSEKETLTRLNLKISKGEKIAIVGSNGAGKSTLANLILGLYLPQQGDIYYDGKTITNVSEDILYRNKSAVFQNFNKYHFTLEDNIKLGDINSELDNFRIDNILSNLFSHKIGITKNTLMGKAFGGQELSGGEWQQVAMARGFLKNSDLIILDEPTSAIDPLREEEIYNNFKKELNNKTAIIITHRLGAIRLVDRIVVLDHGNIIEEGTHKELLGIKGHYYKMWTSQAHLYQGDL